MNQEKRLEILKALQADNPTPKTELEYHSNFELLIAVVLSAQATDKSVNEATRVLFPLANTPQAVLDLGPEKFTDIIKHIGLYRSKTKNVMKLCEDLIEHHNGQVPTDFDSLIKLPGVGQKTASVVMNVAFEKPTIAVDTHVFRVANRTGYAKGKTPEIVQKKWSGTLRSPIAQMLITGSFCSAAISARLENQNAGSAPSSSTANTKKRILSLPNRRSPRNVSFLLKTRTGIRL